MDPRLEFYLGISLTLLLSGLIFFVMMILQKKKEADADWKYQFTLRTRGINPELETSDDQKA